MFEKLKLSMHMSNSKHFAKEVGRLVLIIKHDKDQLKEDDQRISDAIAKGDAQGIRDIFMQFIELCGHDGEVITKMSDDEHVIEHRVLQSLHEVAQKFDELSKENVLHKIADARGGSDAVDAINADVKDIHEQIEKIVSDLRREKLKARDLKQNHERMRDRKLWPDAWLFHSIKVQAKIEARAARDESGLQERVFKDLEKLADLLAADHNPAEEARDIKEIQRLVKPLNSDLKRFLEDIKTELKEAMDIEQELIVLAFRLHDMNEHELARLADLMNRGYPHKLAEDIEEAEKKYLASLHDDERDEYHMAAQIHREAKHL